jgi:hypothetical protein
MIVLTFSWFGSGVAVGAAAGVEALDPHPPAKLMIRMNEKSWTANRLRLIYFLQTRIQVGKKFKLNRSCLESVYSLFQQIQI